MSFNLKRIHYYVLKSFFKPFLLTFFIGLFFLQLQFLYRHIGELVGKGVGLVDIAEMMLYVTAALLPFNFPLAVLMASVIAFGTLGENYELVAMKSAGISLFRILSPLFWLVTLLVILAFFVANTVIPETNVRYMCILNGIQQQRPELLLTDGVFSNEINGYSIKVEKIDKKTSELSDVIIYNHLENDEGVTVAPRGTISVTNDKRYVVLSLFNGTCYRDGNGILAASKNKSFNQKITFEKQVMRIRLHGFDFSKTEEAVFANHYRMLTIRQLNTAIDSLTHNYHTSIKVYLNNFTPNPIGRINSMSTLDVSNLKSNESLAFNTLTTQHKLSVLQLARTNVQSNIQNILQAKSSFYDSQKKIRQYHIEKHRKISLSLALFIFFLIGSSFGAVVRKGGLSIPVVFCFLLLVVYFVAALFGERLALSGVLSVFTGAWLSYFALLPLAIWLCYQAVNDSTIMVSDSYQKIMSKIARFF